MFRIESDSIFGAARIRREVGGDIIKGRQQRNKHRGVAAKANSRRKSAWLFRRNLQP